MPLGCAEDMPQGLGPNQAGRRNHAILLPVMLMLLVLAGHFLNHDVHFLPPSGPGLRSATVVQPP